MKFFVLMTEIFLLLILVGNLKSASFKPLDSTPCVCDLTNRICDLNCCCDTECSDYDRLAFHDCDEVHLKNTLHHTCVTSEVVYRVNFPLSLPEFKPGHFCMLRIIRDKGTRTQHILPNVTSSTNVDRLVSQYRKSYKGYEGYRTDAPTSHSLDKPYYTSGDPILIVTHSKVLGLLSLPDAVFSTDCFDRNPAFYMLNKKNSCNRFIKLQRDCTENSIIDASKFYKGFKIVEHPDILSRFYGNKTHSFFVAANGEIITLLLKDLLDNDYLGDIEPASNHECIDENGTITTCSSINRHPKLSDSDKRVCNNVCVKVKYIMQLNGRDGIKRAVVKFTFKNISVPAGAKDDDSINIEQIFQTKFVTASWNSFEASEEVAGASLDHFSGNPGYIVGLPLRVGLLGKYQDVISMDKYPNGLTLMRSIDGDCRSRNRAEISFGYDMQSICFFLYDFDTNNKPDCDKVQSRVWNALIGSETPTHIASYGNSNPNNIEDWVQIQGLPDQPLKSYSIENSTFCSNLISGMHLEILHAKTGNLDSPQERIFAAKYKIKYRSSSEENISKFTVVSTVLFIDISVNM